MDTPAFFVLPVNILRQFRSAAETMKEANTLALGFAASGHDEVLILQPVALFERSTDVSQKMLIEPHQLVTLPDEAATPLHIERQLELVPPSASDTTPSIPAAQPLAQADGAASNVCGFVAEDGRVCIAMPHDNGGHLLEAPVTDASRTVQASGQP